MFSREAWRLLEANYETVLRETENLSARAAMQLGAHLAGRAIENSMLGATHALANPLTAHYGLAHGLAIGLMLPHVIRFNSAICGAFYADLLGSTAATNGKAGRSAEDLAARIEQLSAAAGLPKRLSTDCGVNRAILPVLADEAAEQWTGKFNPRPVGHAELLQLYDAAF
jgi:alcohol dehydrogenase